MSIRGQVLQQQQQQPPPQQQNGTSSGLNSSIRLSSHNNIIGGVGQTTGPNGGVLMQKSVAIVTPQRSNSLDYLNFEERRQLIASSLSLSDILNNPAKEVANNNTAIGKEQSGI